MNRSDRLPQKPRSCDEPVVVVDDDDEVAEPDSAPRRLMLPAGTPAPTRASRAASASLRES